MNLDSSMKKKSRSPKEEIQNSEEDTEDVKAITQEFDMLGLTIRLRNTRDNLLNVWIGRFVTVNCYIARPRIGFCLYFASGHITLDVYCIYSDFQIGWYWNPPSNVLDRDVMKEAIDSLPDSLDVPSVFVEGNAGTFGIPDFSKPCTDCPHEECDSSWPECSLFGETDPGSPFESSGRLPKYEDMVGGDDDVRPDDLESYPSGTLTVHQSEDKYR